MFVINDEYIHKKKVEFYHYLVGCAYDRLYNICRKGDDIQFSHDRVMYHGKVIDFELHDMLPHEIHSLDPFNPPQDQIHLIKLFVVFEPYQEKTWSVLTKSDYKKYMVQHNILFGEINEY